MLELQAALLTPDSAIATHSIWIEKPTKHICTTSHMATTVFDVICLATGDTKHLYHAYFGCIQFKLLRPRASQFKPDTSLVDVI